jgi:hypothetical protein
VRHRVELEVMDDDLDPRREERGQRIGHGKVGLQKR